MHRNYGLCPYILFFSRQGFYESANYETIRAGQSKSACPYCFRMDWCLFCDADVAEEDVGFVHGGELNHDGVAGGYGGGVEAHGAFRPFAGNEAHGGAVGHVFFVGCLLYTSDAADER